MIIVTEIDNELNVYHKKNIIYDFDEIITHKKNENIIQEAIDEYKRRKILGVIGFEFRTDFLGKIYVCAVCQGKYKSLDKKSYKMMKNVEKQIKSYLY